MPPSKSRSRTLPAAQSSSPRTPFSSVCTLLHTQVSVSRTQYSPALVRNFIKHFKRERTGVWLCETSATLDLPQGRIQVAPGTRFTLGSKFMNVELFSSLGPSVGAVKSGKIRALAVTSLKRSAAFPDVPTMDEAGLKGFESTAWYGLLGPAGLPPEAVERLTGALQRAGQDKRLIEQIDATGCDTEIMNPAQTVQKIRTDSAKWGAVVKEANIKAE